MIVAGPEPPAIDRGLVVVLHAASSLERVEEGATGGYGSRGSANWWWTGGASDANRAPGHARYPHYGAHFGQLPLFLFITFVTGREILRTRATTRGECVATLRTNERRVYPTDNAVPLFLSTVAQM